MVERKPLRRRFRRGDLRVETDLFVLESLARRRSQEYVGKMLRMTQQAVSKRARAFPDELHGRLADLARQYPDGFPGPIQDRIRQAIRDFHDAEHERRRLDRLNRSVA